MYRNKMLEIRVKYFGFNINNNYYFYCLTKNEVLIADTKSMENAYPSCLKTNKNIIQILTLYYLI